MRPAVLNIGIDLVSPAELSIVDIARARAPESAILETAADAHHQPPESAVAAEPASSSDGARPRGDAGL